MAANPAYCSHCGAPLGEGARFCSKCGHAVDVPLIVPPVPPSATVPPVPPVPPMPQGERVLDVIGSISQRKGFMGTSATLYHLVLTGERMIFALQTPEMQKRDAAAAQGSARGFFGKIGAGMSSRKGEKYLALAPAAILSEVEGNFAIPYADLTRVEIYPGDFEDNAPDTMKILTTTGKHEFQIQNHFQVKKQLQAVLGNKVK